MSWLKYGLNANNVLVAIDFAPRGRTPLRCPYCQGNLTAKKGNQKAHHFAHTAHTCRMVAERESTDLPFLPLYNKFNLHLSAIALQELQQLWQRYGVLDRSVPRPNNHSLIEQGCLAWNAYRGRSGGFEFTKLGKIPVGALSLQLFNALQQELVLDKLQILNSLTLATLEPTRLYCRIVFLEKLADLRLYRAQLKPLLESSLYYLRIEADGQTLYKIGVTRREVSERVSEIKLELRSHFESISIQILGVWAHRGNVEHYFKYRYAQFRKRIGTLSEYFQFADPADAKAALSDLRRMRPKVLSLEEDELLNGQLSEAERRIETTKQEFLAYERQRA